MNIKNMIKPLGQKRKISLWSCDRGEFLGWNVKSANPKGKE